MTDSYSFPDHEHALRNLIHKKASQAGCLHQIEDMTDIDAIRYLQEQEGFNPCYGREVPLNSLRYGTTCGEIRCIWYTPCQNYRRSNIIPIDSQFVNRTRSELTEFVSFIMGQNEAAGSGSFMQNAVGVRIETYQHLPLVSRKLLLVSPRTIFAESLSATGNANGYILSQRNYRGYPSNKPIMACDVDVLFTTNIDSLATFYSEAKGFFKDGNLAYIPSMTTLQSSMSYGYGESSESPTVGVSISQKEIRDFKTPHLGLADGDVYLSKNEFAPIINLELPVLENINFNDMQKVMRDFPEELGTFKDFLFSKVDDMTAAAVGSESFEKECRKIDREIRDHLRKLKSDYEKAKLKAAFAMLGCAVASWTLALYCIVKGQGEILTVLGPGGITFTASAAYSNYLVNKLDLKTNPVYLLWILENVK